jgi:hypothetical protein
MPLPKIKKQVSVMFGEHPEQDLTNFKGNKKCEEDKIGVRNPYAIASLIALVAENKSNPWRDDPRKNQQEMVRLINIGFPSNKKEYPSLFSREAKSPLFMSQKEIVKALNPRILSLINKNMIANIIGSSSIGSTSHGHQGSEAGLAPSTAVADKWDFAKDPAGNPVKYYFGSRSELNMLNDVNQGTSEDCWVLAALYSLAWVDPLNFPKSLREPVKTVSLTFANRNGGTYPIQTVSTEYLITSPNNPTSCRFNPDNIKMWAAAYEKAYAAVYKDGNGNGVPPSGLNYGGAYPNYLRPDTIQFGKGNPIIALQEIGKKVAPEPVQTYNSSNDTFNSAVVWEKIKTNCKESPNAPGYSFKTKVPMVTYTYDDQLESQIVAKLGLSYQNEVIVACHSYSLLGIYQQDSETNPAYLPNANSYIVLKNPWGLLPGIANIPTMKPDPQSQYANDPQLRQDAFATGTWKPCSDVERDLTLSAQQDGIFGLSFPQFMRYFKIVGWIE